MAANYRCCLRSSLSRNSSMFLYSAVPVQPVVGALKARNDVVWAKASCSASVMSRETALCVRAFL